MTKKKHRWGAAEWFGLIALIVFLALHPKAALVAAALLLFAAVLAGLF